MYNLNNPQMVVMKHETCMEHYEVASFLFSHDLAIGAFTKNAKKVTFIYKEQKCNISIDFFIYIYIWHEFSNCTILMHSASQANMRK